MMLFWGSGTEWSASLKSRGNEMLRRTPGGHCCALLLKGLAAVDRWRGTILEEKEISRVSRTGETAFRK